MGAATPRTRSILIINPNTTTSMTESLQPLIDSLGFTDTQYTYFTAPSGVPSINNESDAARSATACLPALRTQLDDHDAFLVCCYSQHPLVAQLRSLLTQHNRPHKLVAGIFEASVASCLHLTTPPAERFGIVSTGAQWQGILDTAVADLLGLSPSATASSAAAASRYAGTETTGLNADQLHSLPRSEVDAAMNGATRRLLRKGNVKAICLGCAGMVGLDEVVRGACVEEFGEEGGRGVRIVDGVAAGVCFLEGALRGRQ